MAGIGVAMGEIAELVGFQVGHDFDRVVGLQIPASNRAVPAANGQEFSIGRESERPDSPHLPVKTLGLLRQRGDIPELDVFVRTAGCQGMAVGRKGER